MGWNSLFARGENTETTVKEIRETLASRRQNAVKNREQTDESDSQTQADR